MLRAIEAAAAAFLNGQLHSAGLKAFLKAADISRSGS
jgi:hypothetical protein